MCESFRPSALGADEGWLRSEEIRKPDFRKAELEGGYL